MPQEVDVFNVALSKIGAEPVDNVNDGSINAAHCNRLYPPLRKALLRSPHWNFAEDRAELVQGATPAFEFSFSYGLPPDLLKIKEYNGESLDTSNLLLTQILKRFKIEGRLLLTNDGEVKIVYVKDVKNPDQWASLFYQTITTWLASDLALAIAKDENKSDKLLKEAMGYWLP